MKSFKMHDDKNERRRTNWAIFISRPMRWLQIAPAPKHYGSVQRYKQVAAEPRPGEIKPIQVTSESIRARGRVVWVIVTK